MEQMIAPPDEQVKAGIVARGCITLARELTSSMIDGKRLDKEIEAYIRDQGCEPGLKGYRPQFSLKPYEWTICLARDNEVVHGTPIRLLGPVNMITVDLVVKCGEWHADTARTWTISDDPEKKQFAERSKLIFDTALSAIDPMQPISLFGLMVEQAAALQDYGVIREFCGHGIGKTIHDAPQIVNYQSPSTEAFQPGRAYAVEPVLASKNHYELSHDTDGWTVRADCLASHNEDTIFVSQNGIINLTGDE